MRPFLKWVGGKYRFITEILPRLPKSNRLIEPFIGGGAIFLNTAYQEYLLADLNQDLIDIFQFLRTEGQTFINYCATFFTTRSNTNTSFVLNRNIFNTTEDKRLKAALFLYLNRHCYNGLMRYNSNGKFNVPFGRYTKPYFPAKEMLFFAKKAANVKFQTADFRTTMAKAKAGDVVYCDPPYIPLSKTASFTKYSKIDFGVAEQTELVQITKKIVAKGAIVVISNHDTAFISEIYADAAIYRFAASRSISCNSKTRHKINEVIAVFKK